MTPSADDIVVYVTNFCPYCTRAKVLLDRKKVSYKTMDITNNDEMRTWLMEASGQRTVPQIFIYGQSVGGFDDLYALDRAGKLDAMLAAKGLTLAAARKTLSDRSSGKFFAGIPRKLSHQSL